MFPLTDQYVFHGERDSLMCQSKAKKAVENSRLMWLGGEILKKIVKLESGDQAQTHDASFHLNIRYFLTNKLSYHRVGHKFCLHIQCSAKLRNKSLFRLLPSIFIIQIKLVLTQPILDVFIIVAENLFSLHRRQICTQIETLQYVRMGFNAGNGMKISISQKQSTRQPVFLLHSFLS